MPWTDADLPDLHGRRAIVTGGSSGIGAAVADALARRGAKVVVASRNPTRGAAPGSGGAALDITPHALDLADLASVRQFAEMQGKAGPLDLLINNAGVMAPAKRHLTRDGFEQQFGTNHLGHFALTGLLLPALLAAPAARVVTVSSIAHQRGRIDLDDLQAARRYDPFATYAQSKLANLMFALELQRRLRIAGAAAISVAAHPGVAATDLASTMRDRGRIAGSIAALVFQVVGQSARRGALPVLMAAGAPVQGGAYLGPDGWREMRGDPAAASIAPAAADPVVAAALWEQSVALTGVNPLPAS